MVIGRLKHSWVRFAVLSAAVLVFAAIAYWQLAIESGEERPVQFSDPWWAQGANYTPPGLPSDRGIERETAN